MKDKQNLKLSQNECLSFQNAQPSDLGRCIQTHAEKG